VNGGRAVQRQTLGTWDSLKSRCLLYAWYRLDIRYSEYSLDRDGSKSIV